MSLLAHGLGGVRNLPVPGWLFLFGGAAVLVLSFVALGVLWREPRLEAGERERPLPGPLQQVLLSRVLHVALGAVSLGLFALVWSAAAFGTALPFQNLAPTFVYIVFWLGLPVLQVVLGDVWRVLNPWRAAAELVGRGRAPYAYPARLGRWPAALLLLAFVTLELAYDESSSPRALALAIGIYSALTWTGAALFGRDWWRYGDGFSVYLGLLARIAPFGARDGRLVRRPPLSGLTRPLPEPGTVAVIALLLGSVAFDGLSGTTWWRDSMPESLLVSLVAILALSGIASVLYLAAVAFAEEVGGASGLAAVFLGSLVPIALVYAVAHYFYYFTVQGQFALPLLSDPYGRGWDVLGLADLKPKLDLLSANTTWYVQIGALVAGHVSALVVAHDRAVAIVGAPRVAARTQYAMLTLMVLYTIGGMWLLSLE